MKTYTLLVLSFLFIGQMTLSEEPSKDPNLAKRPVSAAATEADSLDVKITECKDCANLASASPQVDQLVINWDKIKSRYSFSRLPHDDQQAILKTLTPEEYETLAQQAQRRLFEDKAKKKPASLDTD